MRINVFLPGLFLIVLIILAKIFLVLGEKEDNLPDYQIGEQQFSLINSYIAQDNFIWQTKSDVEFALRNSFFSIAEKGGFSFDSDSGGVFGCGDYGGFQIISSKDNGGKNCFPKNIFKEISRETSKQLSNDFSFYVYNDKIYAVGSYNEVSKPVKIKPSISSFRGLVTPPLVSYEDANAVSRKCNGCSSLSEKEFMTLYSFSNPSDSFLILGNPLGNVVEKSFGELLLSIADAWHDEECGSANGGHADADCKAKLYVSSISSGKHSVNSLHSLGKAADISRCIDKDGVVHYSINFDDSFEKCYNIIKEFMAGKGTFIGHEDCILSSGMKCASAERLIGSHQDHIHIDNAKN